MDGFPRGALAGALFLDGAGCPARGRRFSSAMPLPAPESHPGFCALSFVLGLWPHTCCEPCSLRTTAGGDQEGPFRGAGLLPSGVGRWGCVLTPHRHHLAFRELLPLHLPVLQRKEVEMCVAGPSSDPGPQPPGPDPLAGAPGRRWRPGRGQPGQPLPCTGAPGKQGRLGVAAATRAPLWTVCVGTGQRTAGASLHLVGT